MDEKTLRALLDRATAELPGDIAIGRIIAESRRSGRRLRRRRLIGSSTASVAGVAVIAITASLASGAVGNARHPSPSSPFDRSGQMAYVLTYSGDVVPVNLATMRAGRPLQTGLNRSAKEINQSIDGAVIVAARGGRTVFVSIQGVRCSAPRTCVSTSKSVILPISTATGRIGRRIRVAGTFTDPLISAPNGEVAYAMDIGRGLLKASAKLTSIDLATGTGVQQLSMPFSAMEEGVTSLNSRTLLLSGAGAGGSANTVVSLVNVASGRAQKPIDFKFGALEDNITCEAVSPDGATGYIAAPNSKPGVIVPIDVATDRPLTAIKLPSVRHSSSSLPFCAMAVAPNGRMAYVLAHGYLMPINLVTGKALRPIELRPSVNPGVGINQTTYITPELAIDPDGGMAYALTGGDVTPIDLATNTALPAINLGKLHKECLQRCEITHVGGGQFLAFSPDGRTVLIGVQAPGGDSLLPIQAATGKVGKPILLPGAPDAIAVPGSPVEIAVTP
jgi:hypothetical protein